MDFVPVDLSACALRLRPGGMVTVEQRRMDADDEGWTAVVSHVETDHDVHADHWEVHPHGEEALYVLSGQARVYLRPQGPGGEEVAVTLAGGTACIVPRGRWHRLELDAPSDLMSVTLRPGSRLEKRA